MSRGIAIAIVLVVTAPYVRADEEVKPTPAQMRAARQHFETGKKLIQQQQFHDAIHELESAYELDPRADHLYNIGVAYQLDGADDDAIQYYRLFLDEGPTGKAAADATKYLASLEAKLAERRAQAAIVKAQARATLATQRANDEQQFVELSRNVDAAEQKVTKLKDEADRLAADEKAANEQSARDAAHLIQLRNLDRRWERDARAAPSGDGRARRLFGTTLLAVGAGGLTYGLIDYIRTDQDSNSFVEYGSAALVVGFGLYVWGELAASAPRDAELFDHVRVVPAIGPRTMSIVVSAGF